MGREGGLEIRERERERKRGREGGRESARAGRHEEGIVGGDRDKLGRQTGSGERGDEGGDTQEAPASAGGEGADPNAGRHWGVHFHFAARVPVPFEGGGSL